MGARTFFPKLAWACLAGLLLIDPQPAAAAPLKNITRDGLSLTYPAGEEGIAGRLLEAIPLMADFLTSQGLHLGRPIYIYLDEELDHPAVFAPMIPHRGIRIPLRAPGIFEDGYLEPDPWKYFLFRGLCLQAFYSMRGGIPAAARHVFGEVISPNVVLPGWMEDGLATVLYEHYTGVKISGPLTDAIYAISPLPDLAKLSNHPGIWPGHFAYRIFGRPFMRWIVQEQGWEKMRAFLDEHGAGIIPIEIDLKARKVFGRSWIALWNEFRSTRHHAPGATEGSLMDGFWPEPGMTWNRAGVYPGVALTRYRGRYGYRDADTLWLSEYDDEGISHLAGYRDGIMLLQDEDYLWDPGAGGVALTRQGSKPQIALLRQRNTWLGRNLLSPSGQVIDAPPGAIQLSGPVRNAGGTIAVAAHIRGNWDIWTYDGAWRRITDAPALELDPWWDGEELRYASNAGGSFQIMDARSGRPLTHSAHAALMPRGGQYLSLGANGWRIEPYDASPPETDAAPPDAAAPGPPPETKEPASLPGARDYAPWRSLQPNFMAPEMYAGTDLQLGLSTLGRDVSGDYQAGAGFRYSFDNDCLSWRLGALTKHLGAQVSRYPLSYSSNLGQTSELRTEAKLAYYPFDLDEIELSLNRYHYGPLDDAYGDARGEEAWGALALHKTLGSLRLWTTAEAYSGGMRSVYGGASLLLGREIYGIGRIEAGKSWHDEDNPHGSFRTGGDTGEGYFTQRPSRLFPLRGFSSNILEAPQALSSSLEIFWPIANLQKGYETLPLFLHRLRLGAFVDAGAASESLTWKDAAIGAGLELVLSMEVAWGAFSSFRMGAGWPVRQPEYLHAGGPVLLMQLGRPL